MRYTTKSGKKRTIKGYTIGLGAYRKRGFVKGISNTTGKIRFFKRK